jgi:predicted nucleic-acid-binding Zn-ribbon protein
MTTPSNPLYPENPPLPEWSVINFVSELGSLNLDEDYLEDQIQEPLQSIREILEDNDAEFRHRICTKCKRSLPLSNFSKDANTASGRRSRCKKCTQESVDQKETNERTRKSRDNNLEHYRERNRINSTTFRTRHPERCAASKLKWREKNNLPTKSVKTKIPWATKSIHRCRKRAKKKGIAFGMIAADLLDRNTGELPVFCPIFKNIRLDYNAGSDYRLWASVDRIVPDLGYVSGNVWVISNAANMWKSNGSNPEERERIVSLMQGQKKKKDSSPDQPSLFDGL